MNLIQQVSANTFQQQTLTLPDGSTFLLQLYFRPMQYGWFINTLVYKNFTINGMRIVVSPNMLRQFKNQIPFGIACFSKGNREPSQQQDFVSGACNLYLLTAAEVIQYEEFLSGV